MSDNGNGNGEPPSWDDLVQQVQGALEELNLNSPENQSLFVEGLKEAMESLESMGFNLGMPGMPGVPTPGSTPKKKPDMQVFEGGKTDENAPNEETATTTNGSKKTKSTSKAEGKAQKKRPDLKVAPPEEKDTSPKTTSTPPIPNLPPFPGFGGADPSGLQTMFKVLRLGEDAAGVMGANPLWAQGKIKLSKGKSAFQNVFRGEESRPYRIECTKGGLQIYLNGQPAEAIEEGQSTDVEAAVIRVQAANDEDATGIYTRLLDPKAAPTEPTA